MKADELERRLRRLERLLLFAVAQSEGVRLGGVDVTGLREQARQDYVQILAEHAEPPTETRTR